MVQVPGGQVKLVRSVKLVKLVSPKIVSLDLLEFSSHPARPQILVAVAKQTISSIICQTILNVSSYT